MTTAAKRKGRGKSEKSLQIIAAAKRILQEIQPCSVRAVCYRLFTEKLIHDMGKKSTGAVGTQLVYAREQGLIPWNWIVDETREAEVVPSWNNPESIIDAAVKQYRKDYWSDQPRRVEVWSEKGTIRGTVAPVLKEYGVTFRVLHGYGSATALHDIAVESVASDKPLTVLYIGDHDPSGRHMSEVDLPARLARYGGQVQIVRLALDDSDVGSDSELPWFPVADKSGDTRYQWFVERFGARCWEVDALSPPELRERLKAAITDRIDDDVWSHSINIERAEIESMQNIMGYFRESISGPDQKYSEREAV